MYCELFREGSAVNTGGSCPKVPIHRKLGLDLRLHAQDVRGLQDLEGAFALTAQARPEARLVLGDALIGMHRQRIAELAAQHRLPVMYGRREYVQAGGLMSYGADFRDNFRRAASYVDKILKGATPADLPVEQPTKFDLAINVKTAKALGLTLSALPRRPF